MAANNYGDISSSAPTADNNNNNSSSPKLRHPTWNQIVRRGESEQQQQHSIPAGDSQLHSAPAAAVAGSGMEVSGPGSSLGQSGREDGGAENGGGGAGANGNAGKRPAWKKPPADGTVHTVEAVGGAVMGAELWPALSGSTRAGRTPSAGMSKGSVDGSPSGQGSGSPSFSQKQADDAVVANPSSSYSSPSRQSQRSTKRSGASSSSNGISAMEPPASPGSPADSRASNPSPRDSNVRSGVLSNSHGGNELIQQHRNSSRYRNGGTHLHGDGHHRQTFGTRRDQERGNQDWNHRNVNSSRDNHATQQRGLQRYGRPTPPPPPPPPTRAPFITPVPLRPYGATIAFPELQSPYYIYPLQSPTFYPPIPPQLIYQPPPDNSVHAMILSQIEYYFSNENLVKDTFLRQNMDEQGWVPISLIARFNKSYNPRGYNLAFSFRALKPEDFVFPLKECDGPFEFPKSLISKLTDNIQIILEALHHSIVVEVQVDKIRKRTDWRRWIMPAVNPFPDAVNPRPPVILNHDMVAIGVLSLSIDERETHPGAAASQLHVSADALRRMPSGDLSIPGETGQPGIADSHPTVAAVGTGQ